MPGAALPQINLPDIGDPSRAVFSSADEQALADEFMREIRAQVKLVDDPEVVQYVNSLGDQLAAHAEGAPPHFTFFVVQDPTINAFAGPAGHIGIDTGLIVATDSQDELASVIAHEMGHVTQHHLARDIEQQQKMSLPALAGLAAAILLGTQSPAAGQAAVAAVAGGQAQLMLNFSRTQEQEADRVGMQILAASGFDPRAMPAFFEKLQRETRYYREPPEFLSTHPVTASRIADTRARAERYPYHQHPRSVAFQLVRTKLEVMAEPSARDAVQRFDERLKTGQYGNAEAARYGLALALLAADQPERAQREAEKLLRHDPDRVPYVELMAKTKLAAGDAKGALKVYVDALELYPGDYTLTRGYLDALLQANDARKALAVLDEYGRHQPLDAALYRLAAEANERVGNHNAARAALAEHYYLVGQLDAAIQQLRLAMKAPDGDFYESSRIEARLHEFEQEKAQRAKQN
jgi:predicted Zn-dependent protease